MSGAELAMAGGPVQSNEADEPHANDACQGGAAAHQNACVQSAERTPLAIPCCRRCSRQGQCSCLPLLPCAMMASSHHARSHCNCDSRCPYSPLHSRSLVSAVP